MRNKQLTEEVETLKRRVDNISKAMDLVIDRYTKLTDYILELQRQIEEVRNEQKVQTEHPS